MADATDLKSVLAKTRGEGSTPSIGSFSQVKRAPVFTHEISHSARKQLKKTAIFDTILTLVRPGSGNLRLRQIRVSDI
jgi:hypothetical protein